MSLADVCDVALADIWQQLEDDMRARVASGSVGMDAIEKSRDALEEWLLSDLDESTAKVYTAEELDLRRALKMEA